MFIEVISVFGTCTIGLTHPQTGGLPRPLWISVNVELSGGGCVRRSRADPCVCVTVATCFGLFFSLQKQNLTSLIFLGVSFGYLYLCLGLEEEGKTIILRASLANSE